LHPSITGLNRFAHYPSNPQVKGTDMILRCAQDARVKVMTGGILPYEEHIRRLNTQCDIYIEMMNCKQGEKQYGSFGMTALEAASLGKVVITNNATGQDLYQSTYGDCELVIANTNHELIQSLQAYATINTSEKANATLQWFKKKHSQQATGKRLLRIIHE